jgi:hypothetical protein
LVDLSERAEREHTRGGAFGAEGTVGEASRVLVQHGQRRARVSLRELAMGLLEQRELFTNSGGRRCRVRNGSASFSLLWTSVLGRAFERARSEDVAFDSRRQPRSAVGGRWFVQAA